MEELLSAQRPAAAVGSEDAGQPSPGWDGRYTNKYNRYTEPDEHDGGSAAPHASDPAEAPPGLADGNDHAEAPPGLANHFLSPTFEEFMAEYYGKRPVLITTSIVPDWRSNATPDPDPPSAAVGSGGDDGSHSGDGGAVPLGMPQNWIGRTSMIAAGAATTSRPKGRLAVVDPGDKERKRANPMYTAALAAAEEAPAAERKPVLARKIHTLSRRFLVAVRDPHIDNGAVAALRSLFTDLFRCCVTTNLYLSGDAGSVGFVEHHDNHDVFAIQLHGCKRWFVGPPIMNFPSHRFRKLDDHKTDPATLVKYDALAGQMLYMPTGWRHYAVPAPEPDAAPGTEGAEGSTPSAATVKDAAETKKAYDTAVRAAKASGRPLPKPPPSAPAKKAESVHLTMGVQIPRWMDVMESAVLTLAAQSDWLRQPLLAEVCQDGLGQSSMRWDAGLLVAKLKKLAETIQTRTLPGGSAEAPVGLDALETCHGSLAFLVDDQLEPPSEAAASGD